MAEPTTEAGRNIVAHAGYPWPPETLTLLVRAIEDEARAQAMETDITLGELWREDPGSLVSLDKAFGHVEGQICVVLATWVTNKGWLTTRRGIVRHGPLGQTRDEDVVLEVQGGLIAIRHKLEEDQ